MDGLAAAALLHAFFLKEAKELGMDLPEPVMLAVRYDQPMPLEQMQGKAVYLVDFSYPPEQILRHIDEFESLAVIDHHYLAMKPWLPISEYNIEGLFILFDNKKSGAMLTWDTFWQSALIGEQTEAPLFIQYLQEYDLWTKKFADTDVVQSGLRYIFPPKQKNYTGLAAVLLDRATSLMGEVCRIGTIILKQEKMLGEALANRLHYLGGMYEFEGVVFCSIPPELVNIAGEYLYTKYPDAPFVAMYEDNHGTGRRKYSFRSRRNGGADVAEIAARMGGKGHTNSAGAVVVVSKPTVGWPPENE